MPLVTRGSFDKFTATVGTEAPVGHLRPGERQPLSVLREVTRAHQPLPIAFAASARARTVQLTGLSLGAGATAFLRRLADPSLDLHVLCWAWDLSSWGPQLLPATLSPEWGLPLDSDGRRTLLGPALSLAPQRQVWGGLAVRVILWQSDRPAATLRTMFDELRSSLRHSPLGSALALLGAGQVVSTATATLVREAAAELGRDIAPVLRAFCSDYIDLVEAYYPAGEPAGPVELHTSYHTEIRLLSREVSR